MGELIFLGWGNRIYFLGGLEIDEEEIRNIRVGGSGHGGRKSGERQLELGVIHLVWKHFEVETFPGMCKSDPNEDA